MTLRLSYCWLAAFLIGLILSPVRADAQAADSLRLPVGTPADTVRVPADSLRAPADVALPLDTTALVGLPRLPRPQGEGDGLDEPVAFTARDSLVITFAPASASDGAPEESDDAGGGDVGTLFGNASVTYDDATLTAAEVDLLFASETLRARGLPGEGALPDTGGVIPGRPQFDRGPDSFTGRELAYNLTTRRGRVVGARTVIEDGFLLGGVVKQASPRVTFAKDATYTTCSLDHPHYGLRAEEMKIVDQEWVYTGPARLYILGVPTPLWLPFGFFPAAEGRRSGPLPPTYGEDDLGLYLRNLGWYWAISDYMDLQLRGSVWSRGSYEVRPLYRYAKRYVFDGQFDVAYARLRRGESQDPGASVQQNVSIAWRHRQTLSPTADLSGNVNLASRGYLRAISDNFQDNVTQTTQSTVKFQKRWPRAGRSLSIDARQTQNLTTDVVDLTLPILSFRQNQRFPFRSAVAEAGGRRRWYEDISYDYNGTLRNEYDFVPLNDTLLTPDQQDLSWLDGLVSYDDYVTATGRADRFQTQASHAVTTRTTFSFQRLPLTTIPFVLNLNPSLTYNEDWYTRSTRVLTDEDGRAVLDTVGQIQQLSDDGFTAIRRITAGLSANTTVYGTFPLRLGPLDGFRHILRPNVGFSFAPDYANAPFNYFRTYTDANGLEQRYAIVPGIPPGETRRLSLGLRNEFLVRIARTDSTGEVQRRPLKLLDVSLSTDYNYAADSLRLGNISARANSNIGRIIRVSANATYSPYASSAAGREIDRFLIRDGRRLLRLTRYSFSADATFRGQPRGAARPSISRRSPVYPDLDEVGLDGLRPYDYRRRDLAFVDFAIPWSLGLNLNFSKTLPSNRASTTTAALDATFDLSLTSTWKLAGRASYDIEAGEISAARLDILRDLHCWEMSFNWVPFGTFKSFGFSIYVKSGQLRDLLRLDVPKQERRGRFGLAGGGL